MKNKVVLLSIISLIIISVVAYVLLTNKNTAVIPASSYVPTFKDFTVHFSDPMNPDTFTDKTVVVKNKDGKKVAIHFEWNSTYTILTLRAPKNGYTIDEQYEITISDKVKTASGKSLPKKLTHSFTAVQDLPKIKDKKQLATLLKERIEEVRNRDRTLFGAAKGDSNESSSDMDNSNTDMAVAEDSAGSNENSTTNVQVDGIDEADIIKTDGKSIFFVRDGDIIISSADKSNSKVLSQIKLKDVYLQEIYLYQDMLITIGQKSEPIRKEKDTTTNDEEGTTKRIGIPEPIYYSQTTIMIYDVKNPRDPRQIREVSQEGNYHTSRILDGYLYLIANELPPYHILEENADAEFRPFIKDSAVNNESKPVDFDNMYFFPESDDEQFLILSSLDLQDMDKEAHVETYLGASEQIYMSKNNLYIAVTKYLEDKTTKSLANEVTDMMIWQPENRDTEITQFTIKDGSLTFHDSTVVSGTLVNQFAMDEQNNTFRVATTKGNAWDEHEESTNNIYTFDHNLQPLGSIEGLAKGERIYSVRFMKDVAYMVTFEQVDPLFVIDLKDPKNPTVLGELKIPGFSNYLHPLDDNHVIGFGQDTKLINEKGMKDPMVRTDGLKISVFDVSDPANPKETYSEVIGESGSFSELLYNHKALYKHPTENLFGFPAILSETKMVTKNGNTYEEYNYVFEGALLYKITASDGIQLVDQISHQPEINDYPEYQTEVKRMVSVDDALYTFSWDKMKVYDLKRHQELKTVSLPELNNQY